MKVLFFVSSLNAGGAERVATTLANAWAQRGDDVVLVPSYLTKQPSFYPVDDAVDLVWLADCPGRWLSRWLPGLGKWLQIRKLIRTTQPDVVVSFLTNVNVNVLIASAGMHVPIIVCERTNPVYSQSAGKFLRFLRRLTYRRARFVVMQTQASVEPFKALVPGARDVVVVPNPLPPDLPDSFKKPENPAHPYTAHEDTTHPDALHEHHDHARATQNVSVPPSIVAMGRLVAIKQFDVLIDAFAHVAEQYPDWTLTIWGDGPLRDALTQKINDMGLHHRVTLAGRTAQPWLALSRADIFAMTSRVEGFPNVLLEAMALGLPCVALDCPSGPAELTRNGQDAKLVPLNAPQALASALRDLMGDVQARQCLGLKATRSVRQRYGLSTILAQWDTLLADAAKR